ELKSKTTYPPVVLPSGSYSNSHVLYSQAQRDTDTPDLGFHLDPIDYAFGQVDLANATISLQPGAVMATYASSYNGSGLTLGNNAKFFCEGSPTNPVRIVRHSTVQEQANTNWSAQFFGSVYAGNNQTVPAQARFRFTSWSMPASPDYQGYHLYAFYGNVAPVSVTACQFRGRYFVWELPP